jgi:ribosomal protein S24E
MNRVQTDNSFLYNKILLRKEVLNKIEHKNIKILECYGGKNKLYNLLYIPEKTLQVMSIEKTYKKGNNLYGDNRKMLQNIDLSSFYIIDADAYGNPFYLIDIILNNKTFKGCWFIYTFIACIGRALNKEMLKENGIDYNQFKKCASVFEKKRNEIFENFLYKKRVDKYYEKVYLNKRYGYFYLNPV